MLDEAIWAAHLAMVDRALAQHAEWRRTLVALLQLPAPPADEP